MALDDDLRLEPAGDGAWRCEISGAWRVARGPLGGYVVALMLEGMTAALPEPRPPRSLTVHFLRPPAEGPALLRATADRHGRGLSSVSARLEQEGRPLATALGAFAAGYPGRDFDQIWMPAAEPPDPGLPPLPDRAGGWPEFTRRLVMQHRFGPAPFTSADRAETGGWLGLREERPIDAAAIALLADAWFPAPFPLLDAPAIAPTVDLTVHFRTTGPVAGRLLLGRFRTALVRDGMFEEDGELWAEDGTLVAQSRQLALLLGS
jgi:acyl-CoA thioesterase